ncbi:MAG: pseudaminic acid synthase [Chitinophagaceae bacterium]
MNDIKIENVIIGENHKPFIIAEMSGNHNKSLDRALAIVDAAAACGADAIKMQTYTADTITIDVKGGLFDITDNDSLWSGKNLYDLYKEAYTPWEWHEEIFNYAKGKGLICFSTPFDETAVDFLENLGVGAYKVASFENTDWPLLKKIASTHKPVIMSTGIATLSDIDESVRVIRNAGCKDLILLKCTSTYPATPENTHLLTIPHMRDMFHCHVGLSDHTMGIGAAIASVALGAKVIEKHFTLSRADGGVDSAFSMEPSEMKALVVESKRAFLALGNVEYGIQTAEEKNVRFKRSIYVTRDIKEGDIFTNENIKVIRPGDGLPSRYLNLILGKKSRKNLHRGIPLTWDNLI